MATNGVTEGTNAVRAMVRNKLRNRLGYGTGDDAALVKMVGDPL
jgi:hypothetical protein